MIQNNIEGWILELVNTKKPIEREYKVWEFELKTWFNWVWTDKWLLTVEIWPIDKQPRLNGKTSLITFPDGKLVNEWTPKERESFYPFEVLTKDLHLYLIWYTLESTSELNDE